MPSNFDEIYCLGIRQSDYKCNALPLSQPQIFSIYVLTVIDVYIVANPDPNPMGGGELPNPNPMGGGELPNPNECSSSLTSATH